MITQYLETEMDEKNIERLHSMKTEEEIGKMCTLNRRNKSLINLNLKYSITLKKTNETKKGRKRKNKQDTKNKRETVKHPRTSDNTVSLVRGKSCFQ